MTCNRSGFKLLLWNNSSDIRLAKIYGCLIGTCRGSRWSNRLFALIGNKYPKNWAIAGVEI
jgi:hypothetical protein